MSHACDGAGNTHRTNKEAKKVNDGEHSANAKICPHTKDLPVYWQRRCLFGHLELVAHGAWDFLPSY